ncbi:MAG: hypothetical protein JSS32_10860 [Verrucomicrobia bacterium]|nr:hypothetical protein [Verrucomicrobiota bacterium]
MPSLQSSIGPIPSTPRSVLIGEGTSSINGVTLSAGYLLIGTNADPVAGRLSSTSYINVTSSSGFISISSVLIPSITYTISEAYNQSGLGGGSVGTTKTVSSKSVSIFNSTTLNSNSAGFLGAGFDGRYVYFVPNQSGTITRYDTSLPFSYSNSYAIFNAVNFVNSNCLGYAGAAFDGKYIYYIPSTNGQITRFDTTLSFSSSSSYAVYNLVTNINSNAYGFYGAGFDDRFIYFVPNSNSTLSGLIVRYDTINSFTALTSYASFDTSILINSNCKGFRAASYDGRYIYFAPDTTGVFLSYDTSTSFSLSASYAFFDLGANVNSNSKGFRGIVYDGRYIYLIPYSIATSTGQITRYDTTLPLTSPSSYLTFDTTANVNSNSKGFIGGVFDGKYLYLVPNNGGTSGQLTRYDTTQSFATAASYLVYDTAAMNSNSKGFMGGIYDGRYVYLVPMNNGARFGQIARIHAYSGLNLSPGPLSSAPNGFSVGTYTTAPSNSLVVSGRVGIGNQTPAYPLDVAGNIAVSSAGSGFCVKEGSNAKMGVATLSGGTATINTTAVTANSRIFLSNQSPGGTPGIVYVSARNPGTSFTITSTTLLGGDSSTIAWILFEPA